MEGHCVSAWSIAAIAAVLVNAESAQSPSLSNVCAVQVIVGSSFPCCWQQPSIFLIIDTLSSSMDGEYFFSAFSFSTVILYFLLFRLQEPAQKIQNVGLLFHRRSIKVFIQTALLFPRRVISFSSKKMTTEESCEVSYRFLFRQID